MLNWLTEAELPSFDWINDIEITVPRSFDVRYVVSAAIQLQKWIPCLIWWNKRALISCDWHFNDMTSWILIIEITRAQLELILWKQKNASFVN